MARAVPADPRYGARLGRGAPMLRAGEISNLRG